MTKYLNEIIPVSIENLRRDDTTNSLIPIFALICYQVLTTKMLQLDKSIRKNDSSLASSID